MLKKASNKIPSYLQPILWSVDIHLLDLEKHKSYIIPQVLNYGRDKDKRWLFRNYSQEEIKNIVLHPRRGIWFRHRLRRWLAYFNIMIDPLEFEAAMRELGLGRSRLIEEVWRRKGIPKNDITPRNTL